MDKKKIIMSVQSVLCILLVIMLSAAAIGIYSEGVARKAIDPSAWVFTREKAAVALLKNSPVFFLSAAVTIAAAVMGVKNESKPVKDVRIARDLTVMRVKEQSEEMRAEQKKQKIIHAAGWAGFGLCMIPILIYITNGSHFDRSDAAGLELVIGALVLNVVPWAVIGLGCLCISFILLDKSFEKETELARKCPKGQPAAAAAPNRLALNITRCAVFVTSVTFIILGIFNGSMNDVLIKAIQICTECVGLG